MSGHSTGQIAQAPMSAPAQFSDQQVEPTSPPSLTQQSSSDNNQHNSLNSSSQQTLPQSIFNRPPSVPSAYVADCCFDFLLYELLHHAKSTSTGVGQGPLGGEAAANRIQRVGYQVGYRFCERVGQSRPLLGIRAGPHSSVAGAASATIDPLEAVKFVCKEFWTEIFRKQVDKLQTNHRGMFVLKDGDLRWLRSLPEGEAESRMAAMMILAFPCGLIRGALSNLGMDVSVNCEFLTDSKRMGACSFNIRMKLPASSEGSESSMSSLTVFPPIKAALSSI